MSLVIGDYPVVDGVHVCVPDDQHVESFSDQWNRWATLQVDSYGYRCGHADCVNSAAIFAQKTGLSRADVGGKTVLDAGCGAGRFSEIAVGLGASGIVAVDLSRSVFLAAKLGKSWPGKHTFAQADLEHLPLPNACVDVVFSIGVLHHTPDPAKAVREIARVLRPGGIFAGWVYQRQPSYDHPLRKVWRDYATDPTRRDVIFKLALEMPRLRDLYDVKHQPEAAIAEAIRILPFLSALGKLDPDSFRAIVGISSSTNDEECRLSAFDWMTPKYQWQYTQPEWNALLPPAGFVQIRALAFPVSWQARRA